MPLKQLLKPRLALKNPNDAGLAPARAMLCSTSAWTPWFVTWMVSKAESGRKVREGPEVVAAPDAGPTPRYQPDRGESAMPAKQLLKPRLALKNWNDAGLAPPRPMLGSTSGWPPWFVTWTVSKAESAKKARDAPTLIAMIGRSGNASPVRDTRAVPTLDTSRSAAVRTPSTVGVKETCRLTAALLFGGIETFRAALRLACETEKSLAAGPSTVIAEI